MGDVAPLRRAPSLADATAAFLAHRGLSAGTRRIYAGTLAAIIEALGAQRSVADIDDQELAAALTAVAAGNAPATWNRKVATVRSFVGWCRRHGWSAMDGAALERRRVPTDDTRAVARRDLEELWARNDVALREMSLWRLLYETAARTQEVLTLDVEDLDVRGRRAVVTGKGGGQEVIHWQTAGARLLARLLRGRTVGPVFLTHRRAGRGREPALVDLDPVSGRARLSYRRAAELFTAATGWTLHQLRHSALTHLAEDNASLALLAGKSRHTSWRTLQHYVRPGPDAVGRMTAEHDPARRRR